jgi:AcrR family transcriptional regulator
MRNVKRPSPSARGAATKQRAVETTVSRDGQVADNDGTGTVALLVPNGEAPSVFTSATPDFAARMVAAEGGSPTREAIIRAGMNLFAEFGYHASTLRKLAEQVGIEAGSLYNHMASKSELLSDMLIFGTQEVLVGVRTLLETAPEDPLDRLRIAVAAHIQFHCVQRQQVMVLDRELRHLTREEAAKSMQRRAEYEELFRGILQQGVQDGVFRDHDTSLSLKAILRLGTGTAAWYRPDGRASAYEIGQLYADMIVRSLLTPARYVELYGS